MAASFYSPKTFRRSDMPNVSTVMHGDVIAPAPNAALFSLLEGEVMKKTKVAVGAVAMPKVLDETERCSLSLSADGKWLRLIVNGHQTVAFHVNYVNKVLGSGSSIEQVPTKGKPSPTAEL
jgi:hypothetical protein